MADRPALDAVIFDAGGTLVRLDFEWISGMLAALGCGIPVEELRRGEVQGRRLYDMAALTPPGAGHGASAGIVGAMAPVEAYWAGMLHAAGCPFELLEEAVARMHARQASEHFLWAKPVEGARETLDAMPGMGLRIACVSNSDGRAEEHLVRFGMREGLEFVIDSGIVGVEKPDPGIFHLALERLGVAAGRALYVGDIRSVDEDGSRAAGMPFVLLDPYGDYADPSIASIATIRDLPHFIRETYRTPPPE